jgi:hypothetical protein
MMAWIFSHVFRDAMRAPRVSRYQLKHLQCGKAIQRSPWGRTQSGASATASSDLADALR